MKVIESIIIYFQPALFNFVDSQLILKCMLDFESIYNKLLIKYSQIPKNCFKLFLDFDIV